VDSWQSMVDQWDQLGVILEATDSSGAPAFVETQRNLPG